MLRNLKRAMKSGKMTPHDFDKELSRAVHRRDKDAVKLLLPHAYVNTAAYEDVHKYPDLRVLGEKDADACDEILTDDCMSASPTRVIEEAFYNRDVDIMEMLLQKGASTDFWVQGNDGHEGTLLYIATRMKHVGTAEVLVKYGADINDNSNYDESPMCVALHQNNLHLTTFFLEHGGNPNYPDTYDYRIFPITHCIEQSNIKLLDVLLAHGVDINIENCYEDHRATLLEEAIIVYNRQATPTKKKKAFSIIHRLLEYNVDPAIQYLETPQAPERVTLDIPPEVATLMHDYRRKQTLEYLSTQTLDQLNAVDSFGKNALHRNAENGDQDAVDFLLSKGVNTLAEDHLDRTPQRIALQRLEWLDEMECREDGSGYPIIDDDHVVHAILREKPYRKIAKKIGRYMEVQRKIDPIVEARKEKRQVADYFAQQVITMNDDIFSDVMDLLRGSGSSYEDDDESDEDDET